MVLLPRGKYTRLDDAANTKNDGRGGVKNGSRAVLMTEGVETCDYQSRQFESSSVYPHEQREMRQHDGKRVQEFAFTVCFLKL